MINKFKMKLKNCYKIARRNIQPADLKKENNKIVIIDCWRILNLDNYKDAAEYIPLGINQKSNN